MGLVKQVFTALENNRPSEAIQLVTSLPIGETRKCVWQSRQKHLSGRGDTPLHIAARKGYVSVLRLAHSDEASLADINYHGKQPLHEAAQNGHPDCVGFLLGETKVCVDSLKRGDWTPLMLACVGPSRNSTDGIDVDQSSPNLSYVHCVKYLLAYGANPAFTNKDGWNCLQLACRTDCAPIVSMLLQHDPDLIHSRTRNGRTCLHCLTGVSSDPDCAHTPRLGAINWCCVAHNLLHIAPSLLFDTDSCGTLPVFDALRRGHVRLATCFLDHASPVRQLTTPDKLGQQAIHVAAEAGQLECLKLIVKYLGSAALTVRTQICVDTNLGDVAALHLACRSGKPEVVQYITEHLTSTRSFALPLDTSGHSPIWYAVVGTAGCGFVSVERRIQCVHLVWDSYCHATAAGYLANNSAIIEELQSLVSLKLPNKITKLVKNLLESCE